MSVVITVFMAWLSFTVKGLRVLGDNIYNMCTIRIEPQYKIIFEIALH